MSPSPESAPATSFPEMEPSEWDSLRESVRKFQDEQKEKARGRAAFFYKEILDIQNDFSRRTAIVQEGGKEMERIEFEKWEDAVTDELGYAEREISRGHMNLDAIAEASQNMIFSANDAELHKQNPKSLIRKVTLIFSLPLISDSTRMQIISHKNT